MDGNSTGRHNGELFSMDGRALNLHLYLATLSTAKFHRNVVIRASPAAIVLLSTMIIDFEMSFSLNIPPVLVEIHSADLAKRDEGILSFPK